jgi:hypothetical protein
MWESRKHQHQNGVANSKHNSCKTWVVQKWPKQLRNIEWLHPYFASLSPPSSSHLVVLCAHNGMSNSERRVGTDAELMISTRNLISAGVWLSSIAAPINFLFSLFCPPPLLLLVCLLIVF